MAIKANFTIANIEKIFNEKLKNIEKAIIAALKRLGEECIEVARNQGNYIDQTGNLRSSIGYILLVNGVIVIEDFKSASKDQDKKGVQTGKSFAEEMAKNYPNDYVLIVVAGMNYAAAVESKSRDVLTSSEIYAKQRLPQMLKSLKLGISLSK